MDRARAGWYKGTTRVEVDPATPHVFMKHHYVAYTRVSTAKQGEGVSLTEQREAIRRYAKRNDLTISRWFEEKETAAKRGRPVFGEMLKLLKSNKAHGVIIHKIDRSARNLKDWATLGDLIDEGIDVHFANESLDLNSRGGRLSADIQAVVAADYIRNLREETRKGFYGRLKQGLYPLRAPLGYVDNGGGKPKTIDPVAGPLVKQAFQLYATRQYSYEALLEEMHTRGLRNRRGGELSKNGLSWIFNNPFYVGIVRIKSTGETFDGVHEALISKPLFDQVQRVLAGKMQKGSGRHAFLFRRLFQCESCGYAMIGERQKGHVYYRCHTKDCPTKGVREERIERVLQDEFAPVAFTDWEMCYLRARIEEMREAWEDRSQQERESIKLRIGKIRDRLRRLTDVYLDGEIEKELFEERKEGLLMNRHELEDRLSALQEGREPPLADRLQNFLELAESLYSSYKAGVDEEKRDLIETATSNRAVERRKVEITLKEPFRLIAERAPVTNRVQRRDRPRILDALLADLGKILDQEEANPAGQRSEVPDASC